MPAMDIMDTAIKSAEMQASLAYSSMDIRAKFQKWLTDSNIRKYSPEIVLPCMDRISDYAIRKKIIVGSLWKYVHPDTFATVYKRLIKTKLLRIIDRNTYKVFITAGQLYLLFLKEESFTHKEKVSTVIEMIEMKEVDSIVDSTQEVYTDINPEDVIAWLVTQPNAKGTLYLENVVRQYMSVLHSAPLKLDIPVDMDIKNVFSCQTPDDLIFYWKIFLSAPNYKQVNSSTSGMFSAALSSYLRYLQYLTGELQAGKPIESKAMYSEPKKIIAIREPQNSLEPRRVDFNRPELCAQTKPLCCVIKGQTIVLKKQYWSQLLVSITEWFIANGNPNLETLNRKPLYGSKVFFLPQKAMFGNSVELSNGKWLYTNYDPENIVIIIRNLCQHCRMDLDDVLINYESKNDTPVSATQMYLQPLYYASVTQPKPELDPSIVEKMTDVLSTRFSNGYRLNSPIEIGDFNRHCGVDLDDVEINNKSKNDTPVRTTQIYLQPAYSASVTQPKPELDPTIVEKMTDVLSTRFSNGYRLNSPIEMARLRSFVAVNLGKEFALSDDELKTYIAACGMTYEGKVYAISAEAIDRIKELTESYFAKGAQLIFFAEFYAKNENWLFNASIVSYKMLIEIFRRLFPELSFTQTYFGYTNTSVFVALESEILRVWGDSVLLAYDQLAKRLPYTPFERIKFTLSQNKNFIWNSMETFSHISRIEITDEEREIIRDVALRECNAHSYVSVTKLPFNKIEERNYELSVTAIHNAVYRICLSDKFDKKGKIITRKGDVFDALTIMKEYCRTIDKCSQDHLINFHRELTGDVHRWIPMEAGNTVMIRIDKENYVADRYVHFDIDLIDKAIKMILKGDYLPLKSFTAFGAFPNCGYTWNLFLLESYCRRFSRMFRFDAMSVNSRNAGAVIRKSCSMNYTYVMADAVGKSDVLLTDNAVGKFLFISGYTGKSTTAKAQEIINIAKNIRDRRG